MPANASTTTSRGEETKISEIVHVWGIDLASIIFWIVKYSSWFWDRFLLFFGAYNIVVNAMSLLFNDKNIVDREREFFFAIIMMGIMILYLSMVVPAYLALDAAAGRVEREVELSPPEIHMENIGTDDQKIIFRYIADDTNTGNSQIFYTQVYLLRTPTSEKENTIPEIPIPMHDPESGINYKININLKKIHWEGLVEVAERTMDEMKITNISDSKLIFEGNFSGFTIHPKCKYYMLVVVVDYWGNARWEFYNVTKYVREISDSSGGSDSGRSTKASPAVWTNNIAGKTEPRLGIVNHYFILNGQAYTPWLKGARELTPGFSLIIRPAGKSVVIPELNVRESGDLTLGIFILRYQDLWRLGKLTISLGDRVVAVTFAYSPSPLDLLLAIIIALGLALIGAGREHS